MRSREEGRERRDVKFHYREGTQRSMSHTHTHTGAEFVLHTRSRFFEAEGATVAVVDPYVFAIVIGRRRGVGVVALVALLPIESLYLLVVLVVIVVAHSHSILRHDVLVDLFARVLLLDRAL